MTILKYILGISVERIAAVTGLMLMVRSLDVGLLV